jgi:hypothetical protein
MTATDVISFPSPYARGAESLIRLGYHPLPIIPGEKRPGEYRGGRWQGMKEWQRFRDTRPSAMEARLWSNNSPEANIAIVLGSQVRVDGHPAPLYLIAVDIDVDGDDYNELVRQVPRSPMVKRGMKGETRFFLAAKSIKSKPYNRASDKRRLVDLLTGFDTRQTVVPPSVHPDTGQPYVWTAGPVHARDLPIFDAGDLERMEEALSTLGWDQNGERAATERAPPQPINTSQGTFDPDGYWEEVKVAALQNLGAWVPALELYGCRRARGGYEAVATWRSSNTSKPVEKRKRNLSIQSNGITDFGMSQGYSAIDLVMAARVCGQEEATSWLRGRLGMCVDVMTLNLKPTPPVVTPTTVVSHEELPGALTRCPGLLGDLIEWIVATSRRPQRGLALGSALTILGTAAGRRYAGPTRTATHLYVLGLARTSGGKDHPLKAITRVLDAVGMRAHLGPSKFMSLSAVVNRLGKNPLIVCPMDEFGAVMSSINSKRASTHEQAISGVLRTAWGCSFQTMATPEWAGRESEPIHSPAMSIFGISTHDEFYKALSGADVDNGFLNRFLLLSTRLKPAEVEPKLDMHADMPHDLVTGLQSVYAAGLTRATHSVGQSDGPLITVTWCDAAARQVYRDLSAYIDTREAQGAYYARTAEMAQRIATIRAIGQNEHEPMITVEDMEWARDIAIWSAERMMAETEDYMSETQNQADTQRVMRIIRDAKGEIGHTALLRAMQHRIKAKDLKEIIGDLLDSGRIQAQKTPTLTGAPGRSYRAI